MKKTNNENLYNIIILDIKQTIEKLWQKNLVRDTKNLTAKKSGNNSYCISFSEKTDANSIMYDKHVSVSHIMDILLKDRQFTVLLYDKSIIQAEFYIEDGEISKERLIFLKKHNRIWDPNEIAIADAEDQDWFADETSIPIIFRIDFDSHNHIECQHPISHLTLSNSETCRIPIQNALSFSEFVNFILIHFYDSTLDMVPHRFKNISTLTPEEQKMLHIGWI